MGFLPSEELFLNEKSVKALNTLIRNLEEEYSVQLVVTSDRRAEMQFVVEGLYRAGLKCTGYVDRTKIIKGQNKAQEIVSYMKNHKVDSNYLIIDTKTKALLEVMDSPNLIKTSYGKEGLTKDHVGYFVGTMRKEIKKELFKKIEIEHNL